VVNPVDRSCTREYSLRAVCPELSATRKLGTEPESQLAINLVAVEKLFLAKFAKKKLRQDAL
jgi:hypothetical protein